MSKSLKVMIAEDEYVILMGLKSNLEKLGHRVIAEALEGREAIDLAIKKMPDLIIMDINLPSLDGIRAIKKINEVLTIPSIIVTGYNKKELIERATEAGVFGYLIKPVSIEDLGPAINIALARFEEFKSLKMELDNTKEALKARKYVERAKGILMDKFELKEPEAMKRLQKKSNDSNKKLLTVAKEIIKADNILNF